MNATSTHDSKRSEDARMRLAVLSELPDEWLRHLRLWTGLNAWAKQELGDGIVPDRLTESYLYQSLVAVWDGAGGPEFIERIADHVRKASREAKTWTSWAEPNGESEARLAGFVHTILDRSRGAAFRAALDAFVQRIEPAARSNSLAILTLKCLAPGLPDFYQGAEDWLFTLTDPDNRRPVDFDSLEARVGALESGDTVRQTDEKLVATRRLLALRNHRPDLFANGTYEPVQLRGPFAQHAFAFIRQLEGDQVLVAVRRRVASLLGERSEGFSGFNATATVGVKGGPWFDWLKRAAVVPKQSLLAGLARAPMVVFTTFPPETS
jgi:(1->4)-alpha-D-glucan 1-alpha-D-glucosylmutase